MHLNLLGKIALVAGGAYVASKAINHLDHTQCQVGRGCSVPSPTPQCREMPWHEVHPTTWWETAQAGDWCGFFRLATNAGVKPAKAEKLYDKCRQTLRVQGYDVA